MAVSQTAAVRLFPAILFFLAFLTSRPALPADAVGPEFPPLRQDAAGVVRAPNDVRLPGLTDPDLPAGPLGRIVRRDLRTGEVEIRDGFTRKEFLDRFVSPGGGGVVAGKTGDPSVDNFYFWTEVDDPTVGTYPMHLKVEICWEGDCEEPYGGQCSGTLIDPFHVITAGHCIFSFDDDHPGWADQVRVIPGYEDGAGPWGDAHALNLYTWEGWKVDEDSHHDVGIIQLDRPIGALTGWRGYGNNGSCSWYESAGWVHRAYPAEDPYDGLLMFENGGDFDWCLSSTEFDLHMAWFQGPSWGGASGTGSVKDGVVWAILRGSDRESWSESCLITSIKFAGIETIRYDFRPDTPDIMPIFVQAEGESFEPGDQLASLSFVLASYANQGLDAGVLCRIFMSPDPEITTGDVWLDDLTVPVNVPAQSAQAVGVWPPPTVPLETAPGMYYLGVIVDYSDANPWNNTTTQAELDSIYVSCPLPYTPLITSPTEGEMCQPLARTIAWIDQPDIETYQLRFGTWCGEHLIEVGPGNQYTVTGLENGTTYYATVRARKYCGAWSYWSDCRSFTTIDIPTNAIEFLSPPEGDVCQDSSLVSIAWQPVAGATGYELRVGESCGEGGTYPLPSSTPYHDVAGLAGGTTYHCQVRVMGACGNWGDWSPCREFSTLPGIYAVPGTPYPSDGNGCMAPDVVLSWAPVGYPCTYEVEWGRSCRMDTVTTVTGNNCALQGLGEGLWYWHVRAHHVCGGTSAWSDCFSFGVDATPPIWPDGLSSPTHSIAVWSADREVATRWEAASDDCSVEYRVLWDHAPASVPDSLAKAVPDLQHTSEPLPDGDDHWFHVLAKDVPGNLAANPQHLGPFRIDATPPDIQVISPVGGQVLVAGDQATIAWAVEDPHSGPAAGELHYTVDAAATWVPIAVIGDPLVATHEWTVPEAVTDSARVRVTFADALGNTGSATNERWFAIVTPTGVAGPGDGSAITRFALIGNHPNPSNPRTTIVYELPAPSPVTLRVYDLSGRLVATLLEGAQRERGRHRTEWDGRDAVGRAAPAGTYVCRMEAGGFTDAIRMMLVK